MSSHISGTLFDKENVEGHLFRRENNAEIVIRNVAALLELNEGICNDVQASLNIGNWRASFLDYIGDVSFIRLCSN